MRYVYTNDGVIWNTNGQMNQDKKISKNLQSPLPPVISAITTKMLVPDILNKIKQDNLRVLVWEKEHGWWNCFNEESDYRKQAYA